MNSEYIPSRQWTLNKLGRMREQRQLHLLLLPVCPSLLRASYCCSVWLHVLLLSPPGLPQGGKEVMFDLFGTNQGKDPFKLGKQVWGRRAPRDQKKQKQKHNGCSNSWHFSPDKHEPLSSLRVDKKDPSFFHCIGATHPAWFRSRNNDKISLNCGYLEIYVIYVLFLSGCESARNLLFWTHLFSSLLLLLLYTPAWRGKWDSHWTGFNKGKR